MADAVRSREPRQIWSRAITCAVVATVGWLSGCGGPSVADRIQATAITPGAASQEPSPTPFPGSTNGVRLTQVQVAGSLTDVDWASVEVPALFCGVKGLTRLTKGEGEAESSTFGAVHLGNWGDPVYLPASGAVEELAALTLGCDNGGGTAAGQIAFAAILFGVRDHRLAILKEMPPQFKAPGSHVPLVDQVTLTPTSVTVLERYYGELDADCCPSGKARTVWHRDGDDWVPDQPQLLS